MHSQLIWFWSKACTGWTATARLGKQAHSCPVRPDFEQTFLPHDVEFHSEVFPNPVALDVGEAQRHTRAKHVPPTVSQCEFDVHQISHFPFRSWCDHCVRGKAREDAHPSRHGPRNDSRVGMDHFFVGRGMGDARAKPCSTKGGEHRASKPGRLQSNVAR